MADSKDQAKRSCTSCGASIAGDRASCPRCGWNSTTVRRECNRCRSPLEAAYDPNALRLPGLAVMITTAISGYLFGFLGALAFGLAVAAVGSLIMFRTYRFRCRSCNISIPIRLVSEGEKRTIADGKTMLLIRAGAFAVGAVIFAGIWIAFVTSRAEETEMPNIVDLERKKDVQGLVLALGNAKVKYDAAKALSRMGADAQLPLAEVLRSGDKDRKSVALDALSFMAPDIDGAIDALIETVRKDQDLELRKKAIWVIGKARAKSQRAVPLLESLINDEKLGRTALQSLKWIEPKVDWRAKRKKTAQ